MSLLIRNAITRLPIFAQQVLTSTSRPAEAADRMSRPTAMRATRPVPVEVLPIRVEPPPVAAPAASAVVAAHQAAQAAPSNASVTYSYSYLPTDAELADAADALRAQLQAKKDWAAGRYAVVASSGTCTPEQLADLRVELDRQVREAEAQYQRAMDELGALGIARFNANADAAIAATNDRQAAHAALLASAKERAIAELRAASIAESAIPQIIQQLEAEFYRAVTAALEDNATLTSFEPQCVAETIAMHMAAMRVDMANTGISEEEWRARQRGES